MNSILKLNRKRYKIEDIDYDFEGWFAEPNLQLPNSMIKGFISIYKIKSPSKEEWTVSIYSPLKGNRLIGRYRTEDGAFNAVKRTAWKVDASEVF